MAYELKPLTKAGAAMNIDLEQAYVREQLAKELQRSLDDFCRSEFAEDPRTHLGASIIGHDCQAYAWSVFRWLKFEEFDGRMLRLFNRGHEEEHRFVRWLRGMGFEVREFDPATEKQYRIVGAKGHFGGSLDGMVMPPPGYGISTPLLTEFKTHSEKSFAKLKKEGVQKSKPQHYRQMCSYGRAYGLRFGLYCAVNKNTDEIHFEIVVLDWRQADDLFRKAEGIVFARTRPQKIAQTATYFECKFCAFNGLCHGSEIPSKNCRSCARAVPTEGAEWFCEFHNATIPKHIIPQGCDSWARIA